MLLKSLFAAAAVAFAMPAFAQSIMIMDPYARVSTMMSNSGAAFFTIMNHGTEDDRLIGAKSDVAEKTELHTHIQSADGVMQMVEVKEGFPVPAGGTHELKRGGDHVMFLGLTKPLAQGDTVALTLIFEKAGEVSVTVPVDLTRKEGAAMEGMQHGCPMHGMDGMQGMGGMQGMTGMTGMQGMDGMAGMQGMMGMMGHDCPMHGQMQGMDGMAAPSN